MKGEMKVGNTSEGNIWIGVVHASVERLTSPLTENELTAITLTKDDAAWLVGALRKELYGEPDDEVEDWMDTEQQIREMD